MWRSKNILALNCDSGELTGRRSELPEKGGAVREIVHSAALTAVAVESVKMNFHLTEGLGSEYYGGGFLSADKKGYPLIISAPGDASPPGLRKPPYHKRGKA